MNELIPTNKFRWHLTNDGDGNVLIRTGYDIRDVAVLQQWWEGWSKDVAGPDVVGEWRDIPIE